MAYYSNRGRFPGIIFPSCWYFRYLSTDRCMIDFGIKLEKSGMFVEKNKRHNFFYPLDKFLELKEKCFVKMLEDGFLEKIENKFKKESVLFNQFIDENKEIDFSILTNDDLLKKYKEYNEKFSELNYYVVVTMLTGSEKLIEKIQEFITNTKHFDILSKPKKLSYLFAFELDILENVEAEELHKKWFWIPFDYYGADEWDIDFFERKLKEPKDKNRLNYLRNYSSIVQKEQNSLLNELSLNGEQIKMIEVLQRINYLQDIRKKITNMSYPFYQKKIIAEFSKRTNISKEIIWMMTPKEIKLALEGEIRSFENRKEFCAMEIFDDKFTVHEERPKFLVNEEDSNIEVDEFKGTGASAGTAKGKVRICNTSRDVIFMEKGEILVAPATTPDFILGFEKAIAVVTDEGGMTSHAAIVSREMNLPCIVGTNNATKILKTGDLIEVNATEGIIRIIEKN